MSKLSTRRARIVRVRAIEHRLAAIRQTTAEQRIADLLGIASRLDGLRAGLMPHSGRSSGASLQAMSELHGRLGQAENALQQPISQAEVRHDQARAARLLARMQEEGAERLRERAAAREQQESTALDDANRPARRVKERRP